MSKDKKTIAFLVGGSKIGFGSAKRKCYCEKCDFRLAKLRKKMLKKIEENKDLIKECNEKRINNCLV